MVEFPIAIMLDEPLILRLVAVVSLIKNGEDTKLTTRLATLQLSTKPIPPEIEIKRFGF
jgi:hypothetical protein